MHFKVISNSVSVLRSITVTQSRLKAIRLSPKHAGDLHTVCVYTCVWLCNSVSGVPLRSTHTTRVLRLESWISTKYIPLTGMQFC